MRGFLAVLGAIAVWGCASEPSTRSADTSAVQADEIELIGEWKTSTGEQAFITSENWGLDTIWAFDNEKNFVITQTAMGNPDTVGLYNKILWTDVVNNSFYACYALFGFESPEDVLAAGHEADNTDPANSGCNGLPWFLFVLENSSSSSPSVPRVFVDAAGGS